MYVGFILALALLAIIFVVRLLPDQTDRDYTYEEQRRDKLIDCRLDDPHKPFIDPGSA